MASTESEIRTLLESWSGSCSDKDLDRLMSLYSPTLFISTLDPRSDIPDLLRSEPISCDGLMALSSIGQEIRDSHILVTRISRCIHASSEQAEL